MDADRNDDSLTESPAASSKAAGLSADRTKLYVALSYVVCCLIWGTTWYAIRVSFEPGDGFPPVFASAIRFVVAILLYVPLLLVFGRKLRLPTLSEWLWVSLAGLFNGVYQCLIYSAECSISGGLASVLMATAPLIMAVIVFSLGTEKVRRRTMIGFCICFAGVALVCHDRLSCSREQFGGALLALAAAFFTSVSNITLKGRAAELNPLISAFIFLLASDIPIWIASRALGETPILDPLPLAPTLAVIYLALMSSVIAFLLYLYMIKHMSLMAISTLQFVLPVLALVVDAFFERRVSLSAETWAGIIVVMTGLLFSMRRA